MTIHKLHAEPKRPDNKALLQPGEVPMQFAPTVELSNGKVYIPQHYLNYEQSAESISELLAYIECDENILLFAGTDQQGKYVQAGMVGRENYDRTNTIRAQKLVYGRKWRIDSDTPTSEVIQTAFLAIKKAREHEVRELLTLKDVLSGKTSAPFSSHIDLPLMAASPELVQSAMDISRHATPVNVQDFVRGLMFGQREIQILDTLHRKNGTTIIDLRLGVVPLARQAEGDLGEYENLELSVTLNRLSKTEFLHELMAELIKHSDRFVEEKFTYKGFARFSRSIDPFRIAKLSIATRPYARDTLNTKFNSVFKRNNYAVDASRAPLIGFGRLEEKNREAIDQLGSSLLGHMPKGYSTDQFAHLNRSNY
jgi:hypothetical protein